MTDDGPCAGRAEGADTLWLSVLHRLAQTAAHEIRNPLNGAVLNTEVIRARASRPGVDAVSLVPFAEAAASELGRATTVADAMLALAREAITPIDLWAVARDVAGILGPAVAREGRCLSLDAPTHGSRETRVDAMVVRTVVAAVFERAAQHSRVICAIEGHGDDVVVTVSAGAPVSPPLEIAELARGFGVRFVESPQGIAIFFPR